MNRYRTLMARVGCGLALWAGAAGAHAQSRPLADLPQPTRLEIGGGVTELDPRVLPIALDSSVLVYTNVLRLHEGDPQKHAFRSFDHQLRLRWTSYVHLPVGTSCFALEADGPVPYAFCLTPDEQQLIVLQFHPADGTARIHRYSLPTPVAPLAFEVHGQNAYVVAMAYRQQTLLRLPLAADSAAALFLPTLSSPTTSISDALPGAAGLTVLAAERLRDYARLVVRQFGDDIEQLPGTLALQAPFPISLTAGRVAAAADSGAAQLVVGTYATRDPRYAQGIFSTLLPPNGADAGPNPPIRYYDLPTLPHFYDRFGPRHRVRASARAVRRRREGLETVARARLLLHRPLLLADGGYVVVAEHYYPRYRSGDGWGSRYFPSIYHAGRYSPFAYGVPGLYGPYDPLNVWDRGFDGYVYTQALVLAFEPTGQLRWQQSFVLDGIVRMDLAEQVAVTLLDGGRRVALALMEDQELRYGVVGAGQAGPEPAPRSTLRPGFPDQERATDLDGARVQAWLPGRMLASGFQDIRDRRGRRRSVFFVNDVRLQAAAPPAPLIKERTPEGRGHQD